MIKNKSIFITGGAGFIANALIGRLIDDNDITVYDNFHRDTLSTSKFARHDNLCVIEGDVMDAEQLNYQLSGDIVIHAAGIAGIDTVIKNPVRTMQVNMIGTANVLEACRINGIRDRVIDFSTSEIYGGMAYKSHETDNAVAGSAGEARWVYAVSKLAAEHLSLSYYRQHGLPVTIIRPFNVYGPGQTGEGAIQVFIKRALIDQDIYINGDGSQIRAWCYVDDFVDCILRCIEAPEAIGQAFNIGNARAVTTIYGLAQTVCRALGSKSQIIHKPQLSADIELRIPSVEKASNILGWQATTDLELGIQKTAEYFIKQYGYTA